MPNTIRLFALMIGSPSKEYTAFNLLSSHGISNSVELKRNGKIHSPITSLCFYRYFPPSGSGQSLIQRGVNWFCTSSMLCCDAIGIEVIFLVFLETGINGVWKMNDDEWTGIRAFHASVYQWNSHCSRTF